MSTDRLLSLKQVKEIVPYSTMQIYRLEKAGEFPKRIKIGKARVAWSEKSLSDWIEEKVQNEGNRNPHQKGE